MRIGEFRRANLRAIKAVGLLSTFVIALHVAVSPCTSGELVLKGGTIHTVFDRPAEALLIREDRIVFAGDLGKALKIAPQATVINLKGAFAYPGFVDSHAHLLGIGMRELTLNLDGVRSIKELQSAVAAYAAKHPTGAIAGRGWIETHWPEARFPTRADIDAVVADRPVLLRRADGHAAVANSKALALGLITRQTADPAGGRVERDAAGEPTGMLIDSAMAFVADKLPPPSPVMKREALRRATALYVERGWTGVHNMSASDEQVTMLSAMAASRALPIRVDNYMDADDAHRVLRSGPYEDPSGRVRVRGIKLYADGALGSRGAALLAPYSDAPGVGLIITPRDAMLSTLRRARSAGAQVATHAIGDGGNRLVLDAYQDLVDIGEGKNLRWRIEHAQVLSPADLPRFAKLGVIASMQPSHAISDLYFAPARLGPERLKGAYAWASLLSSGAVIAGGSDAPVERGKPLEEFYAAIYRHDLKGFAGPDWHSEEAVAREQALTMFTAAPAFAVFREAELGTLEVGKRADISVFSVDLMTANPAEIATGRAVMTIVDGEVVFDGRSK
jgi:predicted amidohydrolase YtcJ